MVLHLKRSSKSPVQAKKMQLQNVFIYILYYVSWFQITFYYYKRYILALGSYYSQKLVGKLSIEMVTYPKRLFNFSFIMLNKKLCDAMPGLHTVAGSGFINSFHGSGKTKGLNYLRKNDLFPDAFVLVSEEANLNERTMAVIEWSVFEFHEKQNNARYYIIYGNKKSSDSERILLIRDSFMLHPGRANYVTRIWK